MVARALVVVPLLLGGGCTLVLDPDNLPPQTDARPIDAPSIDADPGGLAIDRVSPDSIDEGTGDANGRPALLVLEGKSLVGSAMVSAQLIGGGDVTIVGYAAAIDGTRAAVTVRIPVLTDLAAGAPPRTLRITVRQGAVSDTADVMVKGLDELTLTGPTLAAPATPQKYSRIAINGAVHVTGDAPLRLEATAGITIGAKLDGNATNDAAGPHGCAGGAGGTDGSCTPGGGHAGSGAVGGGGGGSFGAQGTGGGSNGGAPGTATGGEALVPIVGTAGVAGNRGNGGGGGAGGGLGGKGGGGGGVISLSAGGDIVVGASGAIEAKGGQGGNGTGGGGGGSGGAILVRSGATITARDGWLSAPGGGGGTGTAGNGGLGGVGRVRIDAATGDVAGMAATPMPFRGPAWDAASVQLVDRPAPLVLRGQPGRGFALRVNDVALAATATPGVDGRAMVSDLPLVRGFNHVCAVAEPTVLQPESLACIDLFFTGR